jgi:hypothetical protein
VSFNHTFRYIDDVLSINNNNFHNYVHLIYPDELEIKYTTESDKSASYLHVDILLNIDTNGRLTTSLYDSSDDFDFSLPVILTLQSTTFLFYVVTYHFSSIPLNEVFFSLEGHTNRHIK